jgi:hypothetical protein
METTKSDSDVKTSNDWNSSSWDVSREVLRSSVGRDLQMPVIGSVGNVASSYVELCLVAACLVTKSAMLELLLCEF